MSWHEALSLEVAVEFARLAGVSLWAHAEEHAWQREHVLKPASYRSNATYYRWHRKRPEYRAREARAQRARNERARSIVVAVRGCAHCGKPFALTLARQRKHAVTMCSAQCAVARAAANRALVYCIDGEQLPLPAWCKRYGKPKGTVHRRIVKLGWSPKRALETPIVGRWGDR